MRKITVIIALFLAAIQIVSAQKVGLVLSGGGAKGAAHIGVIKALEENNIPIDYITGMICPSFPARTSCLTSRRNPFRA